MKKLILLLALTIPMTTTFSQVTYPYPLQSFKLVIENKEVQMRYMDVKPVNERGKKAIMLLHGKNFNGFYWKDLIPYLSAAGYRVIVPDQVGWGESDRPFIHYSFHQLASNCRQLLLSLGIEQTVVLGHSMGGMLATRFALLYPGMTSKLILENPIGLEDYRRFVPYQPIDSLFKKELNATYDSYKKYQQSYYPAWKPAFEPYVAAQAMDLDRKNFDSIAFINALTYEMIYEQPVCYEFADLKVPVLLVIGQADRTIVGKDRLNEHERNLHGNYPALGKTTQGNIPGSMLKPLEGIGHIPHIQNTALFWSSIKDWLQ